MCGNSIVERLLFRQEEIEHRELRDEHGRFIGRMSSRYADGTLCIPLVDEQEASMVSPGFNHVYLTHDIDAPFAWWTFRGALGGMLRTVATSPNIMFNPMLSYFGFAHGLDPYDSFDWIVEQDGRVVSALGESLVTPAYFVMANEKSGPHDGNPYLKSRAVKNLLKKLMASGAEIGLHASYQAGENPRLIAGEKQRLEHVIGREIKWNRNHYLRSKEPEDMTILAETGITDDFTLGYPDVVGFRVGTCRPYKWHDVKSGKETNLTIHPMTIMECTLDMKKYMGLEEESAFMKCKAMIDEVYKYHGDLVLLWHNTSLARSTLTYHRRLYPRVLDYIIKKGCEAK